MTDDASTGFRPTGPAGLRGDVSFEMQDPKTQLGQLLSAFVARKPFSELSDVTFHHRGAELTGHVLLDTVEESGYTLDDFDAVGALTAAAVPLVTSMITAAGSRGQDLDGFVMDFVYPSIKGPSIKGKRVILVDSWLSEKSYVQTSSLVTLRNGNELSLDFGIVKNEGAEVLAVAALIGGPFSTLKVIHPVTGDESDLPFIRAYDEDQLRG
ncbi:orotate phosphoribosyltransferase [Bifidobacterium vespertilionis]|uniref:Orotate phosphoribosyltransferase n=1 Tax=Bifidobacterium vespertilionis TaxID=2562524 RepID=A0A5J5DVY6_9BIFI|nr:orotate phosphoribosyltransferase [Bifidobacterium vespertilionis]KAA8822740.1 orotate phosphoribosyltransferase [Bifidobacterium vespertilionis]